MDEIDRLGWAAGTSFDFFGLKVGVRVSKPEALDRLPATFPPGARPIRASAVDFMYSVVVGGEGPRPGVKLLSMLYAGSLRLARSRNFEEVVETLREDMKFTVLGRAPRRLFIHAGAVGIGDRAVLLPGRSMSGKSSLVAALLAAGATCYSDEYAMIDERGRVHPFRLPLSMRRGPEKECVPCEPEALGGTWGTGPLPIDTVLLTRYRPGARFAPRTLSHARGVVEVFAHALTAVMRPRRAMSWLRDALSGVRIIKGVRDEAGATARRLIAQLQEVGQ